jgi:large subunit ribosomal protein L7/L12
MAGKSYEKLIDQIGEMSVIELAEMVKALETKFGVSATPVATVSNASAAPVAEAPVAEAPAAEPEAPAADAPVAEA